MQSVHLRERVLLVCLLLAATIAVPMFSPTPAGAAPTGYVKMSDGTLIAVNVRMPNGFVKGKRYPTVFEMSGYDVGLRTGSRRMAAREAGA